MTRTVLTLCSAAFLATTACAPLMQAPLMYSSKTQAGVNVSTTSTESPGLELSMGYKQVDIAYVPVAVARDCPRKAEGKCEAKMLEIVPIRGTNGERSGTKPSEEGLSAARNRANTLGDAARAAKAELDDQNAGLATRDAELQRAQAARKAANTVLAGLSEGVDATNERKAASDAETAYEAASKAYTTAEQNRNAALVKYEQAAGAAATADKEARDILSALQDSSSTDRDDAFSVFGSFNGSASTKGDKDSVSANGTVGKVFTTGVASQIVALGVSRSAAVTAASECVARATDLVNGLTGTERATAIGTILAMCDRAAATSK